MTKMETKSHETHTESVGGEGSMTLLNLTNFPPGGWKYFEPSLMWRNEDPLNGEGLDAAVKMLQMVRAQNPASNLDPSYAACREAIIAYTCTRLKYDPRWCGLPPAEVQRQESLLPKGVNARRRCASCGRR
jgi:hypothetical protein